MERVANSEPTLSGSLGRQILTLSSPLENAEDLDPLLERIGDARYVLLGEASHGTHEYYLWRARISRRLIEEKGFRFIAVEGAGDCYRVNRYIQGGSVTRPPRRRCAATTAGRPGCGPTGGRRSCGVVAPVQRAQPGGRAGRLLRTRRLLAVGIALRDHQLSQAASSGRRRGCLPGLPLLRALRRGPAGIRPRHPLRSRRLPPGGTGSVADRARESGGGRGRERDEPRCCHER